MTFRIPFSLKDLAFGPSEKPIAYLFTNPFDAQV